MINENDFFRQATLLICSSLNVDTALKRFMTYLENTMPVSGLVMAVYEPEMNVGRMLSMIWPPFWEKPPDTVSFSKEIGAYIQKAMDDKAPIKIINDVEKEDPEIRKIMASIFPENASRIVMDLALEAESLGSLILFAEGKNRYTENDAHLISLLHEPLAVALSNILKYREISRLRDLLADDNRYLRHELRNISGDHIIGTDFGLKNAMEMVRQVSPLNSPVLILGETGVGKELVANSIHESSERKGTPFIKVNCGAIPETLIDSELFGHEKGAFTGAVSQKRGRFERAHMGTLFLDEVGELPMAAQVRLLRVLQNKEIERVGGIEPIPVDVRIISASHRNLETMVRSGSFREDLWYRLNVFPITIPPLRQRTEDIPALVTHFIDKKSRDLKIWDPPVLAPGSMEGLQAHTWPGNVRELENLVERALIQSQVNGEDRVLRFRHLSTGQAIHEKTQDPEKPATIYPLDHVIADYIRHVLERAEGKVEGVGGAADLLGIHPSTLRARMRKLGISFGRKSITP
jgi:formate hydrogenlyase transcriptional activator